MPGRRWAVRLALILILAAGAGAAGARVTGAQSTQQTGAATPPPASKSVNAAARSSTLNLGEPLPVQGYDVIGFIETVRITSANLDINAKVDSGARTSSTDASRIVPFQRDGKPWVRFTLHGDNGQTRRMERPVHRVARIRRAGVTTQERFVVLLALCVGTHYRLTEVNLTNRSNLRYRMILGRHYMMERFLIDPAALFLTEPDCPSGRDADQP
ncbi:MAG: RimK/LysX family protein [Alphaproteobacteria bacterium]|nr:RimK/LysX family protein [Alphaproteobacteria bacterium]